MNAEPVPHVTPLVTTLVTETGRVDGDDELNQQIADAVGELIRHAHDLGQAMAADFGLTVSDTKALVMLEAPMTMKELGLRMGCDPSFVTTVADALEKRGLARREPSSGTDGARTSCSPGGRGAAGQALRRGGGAGAVVRHPGHRRAPVPAHADAEDALITGREVRLSQLQRVPRHDW